MLEIVAGIIIGPSVLGWVDVDTPIAVLSLVGLAFLLFLAGLEIDLLTLRGDLLRLTLLGFGLTLVLGLAAGLAFDAVGWVSSPVFVAIALAATSLGLVVPVLKDAGLAEQPLGQYTIAGATVADFGAVLLLSFLFSEAEGGTASRLITFGMFVAVVAAVAVGLSRAGRSRRVEATLVALQDTTAEIRVRIAVALLIGFVALAAHVGLETILGAFLAGAVLGLVDRDTATHPHFRLKLEAVGYGFVIPVFFVTSGLRFDLDALTAGRVGARPGAAVPRRPVRGALPARPPLPPAARVDGGPDRRSPAGDVVAVHRHRRPDRRRHRRHHPGDRGRAGVGRPAVGARVPAARAGPGPAPAVDVAMTSVPTAFAHRPMGTQD